VTRVRTNDIEQVMRYPRNLVYASRLEVARGQPNFTQIRQTFFDRQPTRGSFGTAEKTCAVKMRCGHPSLRRLSVHCVVLKKGRLSLTFSLMEIVALLSKVRVQVDLLNFARN